MRAIKALRRCYLHGVGRRGPALFGLLCVVGCGGGGPPAADGGDVRADAPPEGCELPLLDDGRVSLDGLWSARLGRRAPGAPYGAFDDLGEVAVPGWLFPFPRFPDRDEDARLVLTRRLEWPGAWACSGGPASGYRALLEFDGADYLAVVRLDGRELGRHAGYFGRFEVELPWGASGELEVELEDSVRDVVRRGGVEAFEHATLQGVDTGGWGVNPMGLSGAVRLRLVRDLYLRNAYAAVADRREGQTTVRIGLATRSFGEAGRVSARVRLEDAGGEVRLERDVDVEVDERGEAFTELRVEGLDDAPLGSARAGEVTVELLGDGRLADVRSVPFVHRRVALEGASLVVDGRPHFARGAAVHHHYRLLPFDREYAAGTYVAADTALERRYADSLRDAAGVGVRWVRPGHLVPDSAFHRAVRDAGMLLYQDFPLHWNTDYAALPAAEIRRQAREFLWRVAAEPAVAVVALHNEAEIHESSAADLAATQALVDELLALSAQVAPHLVAIGNSGGRATAQFPGNPSYPIDDDIDDVHSYFGSWWQPETGWDAIGDRVAGLLAGSSRPVLWSEMGNGWTRHYVYLSALEAELEPAAPVELVALRRSLEEWLIAPDGTALTLRQFYALVYCRQVLSAPPSDLEACVREQSGARTDPELIAFARRYFLGDRAAVEGDPDDPVEAGVLVAAHWLAAQIFESRWRWSQRAGFLGVIAWERGENGYPHRAPGDDGGGLLSEAAVRRSREILAAANAPIATSLRATDDGVEVRLVNDGEAADVALSLSAAGGAAWTGAVTVAARSGSAVTIPGPALAGAEGRVLTLAASVAGEPVSEARLRYPAAP